MRVQINGEDRKLIVIARADGEIGGAVNGDGQHPTVVVVNVFAQKIHAPRRADNELRRGVKSLLEAG